MKYEEGPAKGQHVSQHTVGTPWQQFFGGLLKFYCSTLLSGWEGVVDVERRRRQQVRAGWQRHGSAHVERSMEQEAGKWAGKWAVIVHWRDKQKAGAKDHLVAFFCVRRTEIIVAGYSCETVVNCAPQHAAEGEIVPESNFNWKIISKKKFQNVFQYQYLFVCFCRLKS